MISPSHFSRCSIQSNVGSREIIMKSIVAIVLHLNIYYKYIIKTISNLTLFQTTLNEPSCQRWAQEALVVGGRTPGVRPHPNWAQMSLGLAGGLL